MASMASDRWKAIEELFHAARELQEGDRAAFLDRKCGSDSSMRRKVEALLKEDKEVGSILSTGALGLVEATLSLGTIVGPYEVVEVAGAGAMGQVYRAHDGRLNRDVAIKALPKELAHDEDRLARLRREATLLASLNHPNVASIYDVVEVAGSAPFLVLEFIEGSTLAERLDEGPFPMDKALGIALQIAMALEAAHDKGIVHRDLKPANIKLTPDGKVKVLDFGLAKNLTSDAEADPPHPASLSNFAIDFSTFAGTPSYMSPEQVKGVRADRRADLWAFGCVIYELLAGRKPFAANSVDGTVTSILRNEPDWTLVPRDTPPELLRLLRLCLKKNVDQRIQHASELRQVIDALVHAAPAIPATRARRQWMTLIGVTALLLFALVFAIWNLRRPQVLRVDNLLQVTIQPELELDPAISPDGMSVAYSFRTETRTDIYVRPVGGGEPTNITKDLKTIDHVWPRWTRDGSQIAFLAGPATAPLIGLTQERTIYVANFPGGTPRPITNASTRGLTWSPDGTKLAFIRGNEIYATSVNGGTPSKLATAAGANAPSWSPDGKWIAYASGNFLSLFSPNALGNLAPSSIEIVAAAGGKPHQLTDALTTNTSPVWMSDSNSLLFVSNRSGTRDVWELKLSDSKTTLGEPTYITRGLNALTIDLSMDGRRVAYSSFLNRTNIMSLPIPESGPANPENAKPLTTGTQTIEGLDLSPDGEWITFDSSQGSYQHIYRMPRKGGQAIQVTTGPQDDSLPSWSPDGKFIAYQSYRNGMRDIFVVRQDGTDVQQVTNGPGQEQQPDWSPDGQSLSFNSDVAAGHLELFIVTRSSGGWGQPRQVTSGTHNSQFARWSPDGRSLAYIDTQTGLAVISPTGRDFRSLEVMPPRSPVTAMFAMWDPDGQTIYFKAPQDLYGGGLWSIPAAGGTPRRLVEFDTSRKSPRFEFATDGKELFFTTTERVSDIWVLELRK